MKIAIKEDEKKKPQEKKKGGERENRRGEKYNSPSIAHHHLFANWISTFPRAFGPAKEHITCISDITLAKVSSEDLKRCYFSNWNLVPLKGKSAYSSEEKLHAHTHSTRTYTAACTIHTCSYISTHTQARTHIPVYIITASLFSSLQYQHFCD